ncbi:MAG: PQQ-dependent sugar dehydrogenase [Chitinophagales bacterium]|nr:PQQ-dependent sugar dehydrogenase [Chitinophagales bacterium]
MKHLTLFSFLLASISFSFAQPTISLQSYATGFSSPVDIAHCNDDRLFIVEQAGVIRIIDGTGAVKPTPFLDINSRVMNPNGGEEGLLGLAFHPDYKNNGYFFLYYVNNSGNLVIARFSVTANADVADANSETNVLTIPHPGYSNHNGGNLEFGPDGMLYIGTGDGGGGGDPDDNSQDPLALLGKILRLDVDTLPYSFPLDNPYYGFASVRNEIWARGMRNPWRFSFDRLSGDLWIGDVGQNAREEIDFQPASSAGGENYGWKCYEGNITYGTSSFGCNGTYVFPVYDYDNNSIGCSVTGGYRYRGCKYPDLFGYYIFTDYCSGRFWETHDSSGTWVTTQLFDDANFRYVSFGEDRNGELYVSGMNGIVYRITENTPASLPTITSSGSATFCPYDSVTLSTQAGYASYEWFQDETSIATGLQVYVKDEAAYTLNATGNNGCVYTTPATTVAHHALPNPVINGATEYCAGDSAQLSTGTFSSYAWSDGANTQTNNVQQGNYTLTVTDGNSCTAASSSVAITENALPQPVVQQTGTLCGAATSVVLSTTTPFNSYSWSTGDATATATVTQAGNYDVSVTDANGCTGVSTLFNVLAQAGLTPVLQTQNGSTALCGGETNVLFLSETFDAYLWSTGETDSAITVQQAGEYWVAVSDTFGCAGNSDTLEIIVVPALAPLLLSQNGLVICANESTDLILTESYAAYLWSTGEAGASINVNQAGDYWVAVTDTVGCAGNSDTLAITTLPAPTPNILQGDSIVQCGDGVIELFTDAAFEKYTWSRGDTVPILFTIESGIFNVTVEDANGCTGVSDSVIVEFINLPIPIIEFEGNYFCVDSGYSYQWYVYDWDGNEPENFSNYTPITISNSPCIELYPGRFHVQIIDNNGCIARSDTFASFWSGISETWLGNISVQPNPFTNELLLNYTLKDLAKIRISMKDVAGKEVALLLDEKKGAGSFTLEINSAQYQLSKGIYFLEIANGNSRKALKVVKF